MILAFWHDAKRCLQANLIKTKSKIISIRKRKD